MNYKLQKNNSHLVILVDLDKKDVQNYLSEAEKYLANSLKLKGFRTGKAPADIAKRHLDANEVLSQATDMAIKQTLIEILIREKIEVLDGPEIKIEKNNSSELSFKANLTVFPEVVLGEYISLIAKKQKIIIEEKEINSTLDYIRNSMAKLERTGQPARIGDRVELDIHISENGQGIDGGESHNHPLILGETKLMPGVEQEILGLSEGENKKFNINVPVDYQDQRVAGKKLDFDIKVEGVHRIIKPELDNDFIKKLGNFNTLEDLKNSIQEGIKIEKEKEEKEKIRISLLNQVIDNSKFDVPEILVNRQLDKMVADFDNNLHQQGMELSLYLAHIKKTLEDLKSQWREQAFKTVKSALILREIAKKEKITVSEEEIKNKMNEFLMKLANIKQAKEQIDLEALRKNIEQSVINEKVFTFLESKAVIT